jgi:hypothetical protein
MSIFDSGSSKPVKQSRIRVTLPVYLLILLIEECAEVIHRACKAIRFGIDEEYQGKSNREYLEEELVDLKATENMNRQHGNLHPTLNATEQAVKMGDKCAKVRKAFKYSDIECGTIHREYPTDTPRV